MNSTPQARARPASRRFDPKYTPFLVPAIMAIAMSFVMSLVQTIARLGFAPNLASAWLTSFAIGAAVAIPTAILVAPSARRLAGHLTGTPRNSPGNCQPAGFRRAKSGKRKPLTQPAPRRQGPNSLVLTAPRDAPRRSRPRRGCGG